MSDVSPNALMRQFCMRARIRTSAFGRQVTNRDQSRKVEQDTNAIHGAARVVVDRLVGADHYDNQLRQIQKRAVSALYGVSMPIWGEDAWRLLPTKNFMPPAPLLPTLSQCNDEFQRIKEELAQHAPNIIAQARLNLGDNADHISFPTPEELVDAYSMTWMFEELPQGNVLGLVGTTLGDKIAAGVERRMEIVAAEAKAYTMRQFIQPLQHMIETAKRIDAAKEDETVRVRASTLDNIKEVYQTLDSFNVTNDPELVALGEQVRELTELDIKAFKGNQETRKAASARAQQIVDNLNSWLTPMQEAAQ